jgi:hypothetical protein
LKQVEEYMAYRKLPTPTRNKITEYFEHRYQVKLVKLMMKKINNPFKNILVQNELIILLMVKNSTQIKIISKIKSVNILSDSGEIF